MKLNKPFLHTLQSRMNGLVFPAIPDQQASLQLAIQYQLEHSQWCSPEQISNSQLSQLQVALRHAFTTVPYYQELLKRHEIKLPEEITYEFIQSIPISTRLDVQSAELDFASINALKEHGAPEYAKTSGSTGRPIRFARTMLTHTFWLAFALRDHLWHARDFAGKLCAIRWFPRGVAEGPTGAHQPTWGNIAAPIFHTGASATLNVVTPLAQQIDWLIHEKPDYLISLPSNLVALVQYAKEQKIVLPKVKEIRTVGETVTSASRTLIEMYWQTKVVDIYTCEEAGYLALQCPETGNYHVQSESVLLEIVNKDGNPCAVGEVGQVLITTLHNFVTPLIRYEVGDMAEFGELCSCGRGLPVIRKIHGRKRNRLLLPDGQSLFPYLGEHGDIARLTGVKVHQFQCIQHTLEDVEVKLVMERALNIQEQNLVTKKIQENFGYPFNIRFSFHDDIPRGPTGKFEEFMSNIS